jgi:hypothetical protein
MSRFEEYLEVAIQLRENEVEDINEISIGKKIGTFVSWLVPFKYIEVNSLVALCSKIAIWGYVLYGKI